MVHIVDGLVLIALEIFSEFFKNRCVELVVNLRPTSNRARNPQRPANSTRPDRTHFSFAAGRHAMSGSRRLFVPRKWLMSPVFEPERETPDTILRVVSSCS